MTEPTIADDARQEFHEARATGIGATDAPKILGLSKHGTALTVYHDKVDPPGERGQSLPAWLGNRMQDVVAELYAAQSGVRVRADNRQHRHPKHDWMVCHLDYRVWGQPKLLVECKTRAYMHGWGDEGTTEIPPDVWVQVQHEMAVTGAEACDVAVLFGHHTFRVYRILRDEAFIESLVKRLEQFWFFNVEARIPPEPSGSPLDDALLRREHPDNDDTLLPATPEQDALARTLALARQNLAQVKETVAGIENKIKEAIGDHAGIRGAFGQITWKKSQPSKETDWAAVAAGREKLLNEMWDLARAVALEDSPDQWRRIEDILVDSETLVSIHTNTVEGSRRFHVKFNKED